MPHDREGLFNAARYPKRTSSIDSRASSTTVDDNGCIITRGFAVASRSSSQSSLARSTTSSLDTASTSRSSFEAPLPGASRTRAHSRATDYALRPSSSLTSLLRSAGNSTDSSRPGLDRRQTWQTHSPLSRYSSRWDNNDLETTTCRAPEVFQAPPMAATGHVKTKSARRGQTHKQMGHIRRSRSEQANLHGLAPIDSRAATAPAHPASQVCRKPAKHTSVEIVPHEDADNAVASESEESDTPSDCTQLRYLAAKHSRLDYATRRAINDERNAALMQQAQQMASPDEQYSALSTPITAASVSDTDLAKVSQKLELMSASLADNAIASDSEDDDYTCKGDPKTTAALRQAAIHRERNVAIAEFADDDRQRRPDLQKRAMSEAALTVRVTEPTGSSHMTSPHQRVSSVGSLTVRLLPPKSTHLFADNVDGVEMPMEVKTYEKGSILAFRSLRPSRTRPKPMKGVLKKSGSPPSTAISTADCSPVKKIQGFGKIATEQS